MCLDQFHKLLKAGIMTVFVTGDSKHSEDDETHSETEIKSDSDSNTHPEEKTIFIMGAATHTVSILVSNFTTIDDILDHLCQWHFVPLCDHLLRTHTLHMPGLAGPMTHFYLSECLLGGAPFEFEACARDEQGNLKDANDIDWYNDADDVAPTKSAGPSSSSGHDHHNKKMAKLQASIAIEQESDDDTAGRQPTRKRWRHNKGKKKAVDDGIAKGEDSSSDFSDAKVSDESDSDTDVEIPNDELVASLSSKTIPEDKLAKASGDLDAAFTHQAAQAVGDWDQKKFEWLLIEWIVACNQPFEEVEHPEFCRLLQYTHHPLPSLHIPSADTIQHKIMKMGDGVAKSLCMFFEGKLEKILINFQELIGEHSGENIAEVVWDTLVKYSLVGHVMAFMMDNVTNNDTMVKAIKQRCREQAIPFSARNSCLHCMLHTVHLTVVKLLEGIGAISKDDGKKAKNSHTSSYQDSISAPLDASHNDEAALLDEEAEPENSNDFGSFAGSSSLNMVVLKVV
ncbi:uncharacterized protein EV420DRAFT_1645133 [Desarmillaria tabescens]|uniref:DUF659 domain-containing protein n=1 Tax=Armillaria tabescens TaxID=1929756 RepID=A0AA39K4K7_ARMTA|nr:uncharacterized protein EV420DRAFT_1645133 [Desarmillaria tabescens]KAK0454238.1 hypothetical protein EV420DRAFT_1645133 [Desarmillaria tabescens]